MKGAEKNSEMTDALTSVKRFWRPEAMSTKRDTPKKVSDRKTKPDYGRSRVSYATKKIRVEHGNGVFEFVEIRNRVLRPISAEYPNCYVYRPSLHELPDGLKKLVHKTGYLFEEEVPR